MQSVALIGAGATGLCAARYLSAKPDLFKAVVFEKADFIGGTWVYTEETGTDKHGLPIHSSMYKNLRTNIPKEIMAFPDLPFDSHEVICDYLELYAETFQLKQYIKFETIVESVKPLTNGDPKTKWQVSVRDLNNKEAGLMTHIFDAVFVCNGHYSIPNIPHYDGEETFTGKIIHSHSYRKPEDFKDATIVCVGIGLSGQDLMIDLRACAKKVYVSHWKARWESELPTNIQQVPPIDSIHGNKVTFTNGEIHGADYIILCTGYQNSFPFLDKDCGVVINDNTVTPLYKHIVHANYHSLAFIGIPYYIIPFPLFSCQVQFFISILEGSHKLPTRKEIAVENEKDLRRRLDLGWPQRFAHKMAEGLQFEYNKELSQLSGTKCPSNIATERLFDEALTERMCNLWHCKDINYEIVNDRVNKI